MHTDALSGDRREIRLLAAEAPQAQRQRAHLERQRYALGLLRRYLQGHVLADLRAAAFAVQALVDGEDAHVGQQRLAELAGLAAFRSLGGHRPLDREDDIDEVAGEHEAGDTRGAVDRDRHGALAGIEDGGEEALFAGMDNARTGDRLAGIKMRPDDGARQILLAGLALDQVGFGQPLTRPRPPFQFLRLDEGSRRHRLLGDKDLGRRRRRRDGRRSRFHHDLLAGEPAVDQQGG